MEKHTVPSITSPFRHRRYEESRLSAFKFLLPKIDNKGVL